MQRIHDRRAVVLLCPLCHACHRHEWTEPITICHLEIPPLTDAAVLWLKRQMDPMHWDPDAIATWWLGTVPEPEQPNEWYMDEYLLRRGLRPA